MLQAEKDREERKKTFLSYLALEINHLKAKIAERDEKNLFTSGAERDRLQRMETRFNYVTNGGAISI